MTALPFHPLANLFPLLDGEEFDAFVADIKAHGLRQRIVLCNGAILEGRNRYRACIEAGIEPRFEAFNGRDPLAYVVSLNLQRRHLSKSQRAMVAAKIATFHDGQRQVRPRPRSDAMAERPKYSMSASAQSPRPEVWTKAFLSWPRG